MASFGPPSSMSTLAWFSRPASQFGATAAARRKSCTALSRPPVFRSRLPRRSSPSASAGFSFTVCRSAVIAWRCVRHAQAHSLNYNERARSSGPAGLPVGNRLRRRPGVLPTDVSFPVHSGRQHLLVAFQHSYSRDSTLPGVGPLRAMRGFAQDLRELPASRRRCWRDGWYHAAVILRRSVA